MNLSDIQGDPCDCAKCILAGVTDRPIRRDPSTGAWLHGVDLLRWYLAREDFLRAVAAARQPKTSRGAGGLTRLTRDERDGDES